MSFLRPEFLWGLPLIAVPVLIHLLNRQRFVRVDFAAMAFLQRALRRTRRRLFLEDLLLLLLRTLAVLLLVLALAKPGVDPGALLAGRAAHGEVVVLDASLSMDHRAEGASAFERAAEEAFARLDALEAARGDQAALVRAGARAERLAFGDPLEVAGAVNELGPPDAAVADLRAALAVARQTAAALAEDGCEEVRVSLWTDFQATNWDLEDPALLDLVRALVAEGRPVELLDCGAPERANLAVESVEVEPAEIVPGDAALVSARLRSHERRDRAVTLRLLVDGAPVASDTVELPAGAEVVWSHPVGAAEPGARGVEVAIDLDALAADDRRSTVLAVRAAPRLLLIGEEAPTGEAPGVHDILRRFWNLGPDAPLALVEAPPSRAARELAEAEIAVLADPARLDPGLRDALLDHVAAGGGLLIVAGPEAAAADLEALFAGLGRPSLRLGEAVEADQPSARLRIEDPRHPALTLFADPRWQPLLTEVPHRVFRRLVPGTEPGLTPVLGFVRGAGEDSDQELGPALLSWRHEGAACAVLAAPPLPAWNRMTSVPGGTLPFLLDLALSLAPQPRHERVVGVGRPLAVELPSAPTDLRLTDPRGGVGRPQQEARLLGGGRAMQPLLDAALVPGVWTVEARLVDATGAELEHRERLAVVPPAAESDLAPLDLEALRAQLPPGVVLGDDRSGPAGDPAAAAERQEDLSGLLYTLMALFLVGETLLAAFLDRRRG